MGFSIQLQQSSLSLRLQVFLCELFELLSVIGLTNIMALQSGLDYLRTLLYPFASLGLDVSSEKLRSGLATEHLVALRRQL